MKTCPNCKELLGDNVESCFKCFYNFDQRRVLSSDERNNQRQKENEKVLIDQTRLAELPKIREHQLLKNPLYEYKVEVVNDNSDGTTPDENIQRLLNHYSSQGWRLHSISINEVGKSASGAIIGFLGMNINATMDQTVLIFERCIKA